MYPQNKDLSWKENGYGIQQVEKQIWSCTQKKSYFTNGGVQWLRLTNEHTFVNSDRVPYTVLTDTQTLQQQIM